MFIRSEFPRYYPQRDSSDIIPTQIRCWLLAGRL
jgi:hypothetical protein